MPPVPYELPIVGAAYCTKVGQFPAAAAAALLILKANASVQGGGGQQAEALGVCMPPQPGTVSALGAQAPGPAVRAAVPSSSASCAAPQEPRLGTVALAPVMS